MSLPVISVAQMLEWEQRTWETLRTREEVIRWVGHVVARRALRMLRPEDAVIVLHGKGNNGQDALQSTRHFVNNEVLRVEALHPQAALKAFHEALAPRPALIIDGIFGLGLNRPLDADWMRLITEVNASRVPVLSIDVPSGLNADTGVAEGGAICATVTLTLAAPKRGLLSSSAWPYVGRLEVAREIGLTPCPYKSELQWSLREDFERFPPARHASGHKGTFGHLAIVAGSLGYHGAAVLAARGAQRAQPGLVTCLTHAPVYQPVASQLQSVMVRPFSDGGPELPAGASAILIGPGLASPDVPAGLADFARRLWEEAPQPVIIDASALDWIGSPPRDPAWVRVVTPHPGEAGRMLGCSAGDVQRDRPKALRAVSERLGGCCVVLKGHQTLIGTSTGTIFINSSGNPHLAQGGSGDVLAGWIAGWLAQPELQSDPIAVVRHAVWRHGAAADDLEERRPYWTIEDLAELATFSPPPSAAVVDPAVFDRRDYLA